MNSLHLRLERAEEAAAELLEASAVTEQQALRHAQQFGQDISGALDLLRAHLEQLNEDQDAVHQALAALNQNQEAHRVSWDEAFARFWADVPALLHQEVTGRVEAIEKTLREQFAALDRQREERFEKLLQERVAAQVGGFSAALEEHRSALSNLQQKSEQTTGHLNTLLGTVESLAEEVEKARSDTHQTPPVPARVPESAPAAIQAPLFGATESPVAATGRISRKYLWPVIAFILLLGGILWWQFAERLEAERAVPSPYSTTPASGKR